MKKAVEIGGWLFDLYPRDMFMVLWVRAGGGALLRLQRQAVGEVPDEFAVGAFLDQQHCPAVEAGHRDLHLVAIGAFHDGFEQGRRAIPARSFSLLSRKSSASGIAADPS